MFNKDVRRTYLAVRSDVIRLLTALPSCTLRDRSLELCQLLKADTVEDVLWYYPALYRELNNSLVTGASAPADSILHDFIVEVNRAEQSEECASVIRLVRQLLGVYSRLTIGGKAHNLPWSSPLVEVDETTVVEAAVRRLTRDTTSDVVPLSTPYIAELLFSGCDLSCLQDGHSDPHFRHGPGAVAEGGSVAKRKSLVNCIDDPSFDWVYEGFFRPLFCEEEGDEWHGRYDPRHPQHITGATASKIVCVPKDFRGPRVIAAEPALHQYVQQGISRMLLKHVRNTPLRYCINLERSELNAEAALIGSRDQSIATLDMSDASDLVSLNAIQQIFSRTSVLPYLQAARTTHIRVDGDRIPITAFAPMGSGLCFTVETLYFALIAIGATWPRHLSLSVSNVRKHIRAIRLRVYGDDILIAQEYADCVLQALKAAGSKPNPSKTCVSTPFRESCGCDAWGGFDVTPLRPRHLPGASDFSYTGLIDMAQTFYHRGLFSTAATVLSYAMKEQRTQGFDPMITFVELGTSLAGKPGTVSLSSVHMDILEYYRGISAPVVSTTSIFPGHRMMPRDLDRDLREALLGAPRDDEGFIIETRNQKPVRRLVKRRVRCDTPWNPSRVIHCCSHRDLYRLFSCL